MSKSSLPSSFRDVEWLAGMIIKPQHLQSIKKFNYFKLFNSINSYFDGNFWGVIDFRLDIRSINEGIIIVDKISAIFKNGESIDLDYSQAASALVIDINRLELVEGENTIHLAVVSPDDNIVSVERYIRSVSMIEDENRIEAVTNINAIHLHPYFLLSRSVNASYISLPLFSILNKSGVRSIGSLQPPFFILQRESDIMRRLSTTISAVEAKLSVIYRAIQLYSQKGSINYKFYEMSRTIDNIYPAIAEIKMIIGQNAYPYRLFCALNNILVKIYITTSSEIRMNNIYNHENGISQLFNIADEIDNAARNIVQNDSYTEQLIDNPDIPHSLVAVVNTNSIIKNKIIICAMLNEVATSHEEIRSRLESLQIASISFAAELQRMRIKGMHRTIYTTAEAIKSFVNVDKTENTFYIVLDSTDPYFSMRDSKIILIGNNRLINTISFRLIVLNTKE